MLKFFWPILITNFTIIPILLYHKSLKVKIFDLITNFYTFLRIRYEIYDPFKPVLRIHNVSSFYHGQPISKNIYGGKFNFSKNIYGGKFNFSKNIYFSLNNPKDELELNDEIKDIQALSIKYSYSDWNNEEKCIKLVDMQTVKTSKSMKDIKDIYDANKPDNNDYNYDYSIEIFSLVPSEVEHMQTDICKAIESYIRRTPTYEVEQTLCLLANNPEFMEFSDELVEKMFREGKFSYHVGDDLGSKFVISYKSAI